MPEREEENEYTEPSVGNCKRCVNRNSCGSKNKKEAAWCERYRPEFKKKGRRRK